MSSTTPAHNRPSGPDSGSAPGPALSLTERRKAATRMEIARAAAGLFVSRGLKATRAEDIAQAAGIAPRTFYRYFATKEEAIAPLYAAGAQRWAEAVRVAPPHMSIPEALDHAVRHTLTPGGGISAASWDWVRTLVRLAGTSPSLSRVWAEVCRSGEASLAVVLLARMTPGPDGNAGPDRNAGAGPDAGARGGDNVAGDTRSDGPGAGDGPEPVVSPRLRFAAAVASAAVRVAVESWAAGDAPAAGPDGPAETAIRNLAAVGNFHWQPL
ncbi:TetR/AcrR family transcriptional regulator [Streptomyces sp. NPDC088387]|uniref:TetR/AcrR family transcriptional regulator n=1 Tax=Streptomyces sp. NPDC088387 TaxID=3365859 RepID=UPI0037F85994